MLLRRTFMLLAAVAMLALAAPASADEAKAGTHEGKVVKVDKDKLTMTDKDGKKEHTHTVPATAKVTLDGKEAKLEDLKAGYTVSVTVEEKDKKNSVTKVEAKKA